MNRRTLALAAVLAIVAAVGLGRRAFDRDDPIVNAAATTAESTAAKNPYRAIAQPEHPRIHDSLDILAPFNARLARELDAFNDDLGIDVHVVTSNDTSQSIEAQSEQLFPQRNIGILRRSASARCTSDFRKSRSRCWRRSAVASS